EQPRGRIAGIEAKVELASLQHAKDCRNEIGFLRKQQCDCLAARPQAIENRVSKQVCARVQFAVRECATFAGDCHPTGVSGDLRCKALCNGLSDVVLRECHELIVVIDSKVHASESVLACPPVSGLDSARPGKVPLPSPPTRTSWPH